MNLLTWFLALRKLHSHFVFVEIYQSGTLVNMGGYKIYLYM